MRIESRRMYCPLSAIPIMPQIFNYETANLRNINKKRKTGDTSSSTNDGSLNERMSAISILHYARNERTVKLIATLLFLQV